MSDPCQICGAHPDNKRNSTPKLYKCRDCGTISCLKHAGFSPIRRQCPNCHNTRLQLLAVHRPNLPEGSQTGISNKKNTNPFAKKTTSGGAGHGNSGTRQSSSFASSSHTPQQQVASENHKKYRGGEQSTVASGLLNLAKNLLLGPEDKHPNDQQMPAYQQHLNQSVDSDLNASTSGAGGLQEQIGELEQNTHDIHLIDTDQDNIHRPLALLYANEHPVDEEAWKKNLTKRPQFLTDAFYHIETIKGGEEFEQAFLEHKEDRQLLCLVASYMDDKEAASKTHELINNYAKLFGIIGYSPKTYDMDLDILDERLCDVLNDEEKYLAIGPIGLDMHYAPYALKQQKALLKRQIDIAADFNLPVYLTHKNGEEELLRYLTDNALPENVKGVWASPLQSQKAVDFIIKNNFYMLVRAEITYPEQAQYRTLLKQIPHDLLLMGSGDELEAPGSTRGRWNRPEYIKQTFNTIMEVYGLKEEYPIWRKMNRHFLDLLVPQEMAQLDEDELPEGSPK